MSPISMEDIKQMPRIRWKNASEEWALAFTTFDPSPVDPGRQQNTSTSQHPLVPHRNSGRQLLPACVGASFANQSAGAVG